MTQPRDDHPLHAGIHAKLVEIVEASSTPPPWQEAWLCLGPESTDRDRLAVYQAVTPSQLVPSSVPVLCGVEVVAEEC